VTVVSCVRQLVLAAETAASAMWPTHATRVDWLGGCEHFFCNDDANLDQSAFLQQFTRRARSWSVCAAARDAQLERNDTLDQGIGSLPDQEPVRIITTGLLVGALRAQFSSMYGRFSAAKPPYSERVLVSQTRSWRGYVRTDKAVG
jgi:hypothetical protein